VSVRTPAIAAQHRHFARTSELAARAAQELGLALSDALLEAEKRVDDLCLDRDALRSSLAAAEELRKRTETEHFSLALRQREEIERLHKELEAALNQQPDPTLAATNGQLEEEVATGARALAAVREENERLRGYVEKLEANVKATTRALAELNESLLPPIGVTVPSQVISTPRYVLAEPHSVTGLPAYVYPETYTSPVVALQNGRSDDRPRSLYRLVPHDFPIVSEPFARQLVRKAESLGHAELATWLRARLPFPLGHAEGKVLP
jgi:hypothetical protein